METHNPLDIAPTRVVAATTTVSQPWTFALVTLGCKVNQYESQALREAWIAVGGIEADTTTAQIIIINSCAITARAERETRNALYRLMRENPQGKRILTGCSALLVEANLRHPAPCTAPATATHTSTVPTGVPMTLNSRPTEPMAHAIIAAPHKYRLLQGPWQVLAGLPPTEHHPHYPAFSISGYHRARPVLKVQDGCSHRCTYCIVPIARGPATSRNPQEVLAEARRLLHAGHGEIMLSGINLAQYGKSTSEYGNFWKLLRLLEQELAPEWAGKARFRISSLEPGQLDAEGIDTLHASTMLCPHVHISLQSGSPAVLKRMGRGHYTPQQLIDGISMLQQHWPRMGLGADILMGFPGEEPAHVQETLDLLATLPMTYAHVFPYSRRPKTAAVEFPQQVPHHEKLHRAAKVREAVQHKQQAFLQSLLKVPFTHVVLDGNNSPKGVNELYVQCRLVAAAHSGQSGKNAGTQQGLTGIIRVKPVRVEKDMLLVESQDCPTG